MNARNDTARRDGPAGSVPSLVILLLLLPALAPAAELHPPVPGLLVVEAAVDSLDAAALDLDGGERVHAWGWGSLVVEPDGPAVEIDGADLRLSYGVDLSGASRGRRLIFSPGTYPVDGPLLLVGEGFRLFVSGGELVVEGERILLREGKKPPSPQAQMVLLLGVLLLTATLMIRARRKLGGTR